MALPFAVLILCVLAFSPLCHCQANGGWQSGIATWYGEPTGAGTDQGACGYGSLPSTYGSNIIAVGNDVFNNGLACGRCYEARCVKNSKCKSEATLVVVTDHCPECESEHLDFSGTGFSSMAIAGQPEELRTDGRINIEYRRVPCKFRQGITFEIHRGTNPYWLAFVIRYIPGLGDITKVQVSNGRSSQYVDATHAYGAVWQVQGSLNTPATVKIYTSDNQVHTCPNSITDLATVGKTFRCSP